MRSGKCSLCGRLLSVEGDELSGDCGGDCWGCIGEIEANMHYKPSLRAVLDEWRRGLRPGWTPPPGALGVLETVTLWRSVGEVELKLIEASGWRAFPPQPPDQPIFRASPVLGGSTTKTRQWLLEFEVKHSFLDAYEPQQAGGPDDIEYWIAADDLAALNDAIVGEIGLLGWPSP